MVVAIDGPAGSGKSTVTNIIGEKLEFTKVDTGATYRCLALKAIRNNVEKEEDLIELSKNLDIEITEDKKVFLDGQEVTLDIRTNEVSNKASFISNIVDVRKNLVELQRKMSVGKDVILEGRDTTTVVFPNAEIKIYLDATLEERANRRFRQNEELNIEVPYEEVYKSMEARDYNDMHKEFGALTKTEDQIYIDTTNMTLEEVVEKITNIIEGEK